MIYITVVVRFQPHTHTYTNTHTQEVGAAMEQLSSPHSTSPHAKQHAPAHLLAAKSIVGHAEPASGLLGLMYAVQQV